MNGDTATEGNIMDAEAHRATWSWEDARAELVRRGWSLAAINDAFDNGERAPAVWDADDLDGAEVALRELTDDREEVED